MSANPKYISYLNHNENAHFILKVSRFLLVFYLILLTLRFFTGRIYADAVICKELIFYDIVKYNLLLFKMLEGTSSLIQRKHSGINVHILIFFIFFACLSLQAQISDPYFSNVYVKDSKTIVMESVSNLSTDSAHIAAFRAVDN